MLASLAVPIGPLVLNTLWQAAQRLYMSEGCVHRQAVRRTTSGKGATTCSFQRTRIHEARGTHHWESLVRQGPEQAYSRGRQQTMAARTGPQGTLYRMSRNVRTAGLKGSATQQCVLSLSDAALPLAVLLALGVPLAGLPPGGGAGCLGSVVAASMVHTAAGLRNTGAGVLSVKLTIRRRNAAHGR